MKHCGLLIILVIALAACASAAPPSSAPPTSTVKAPPPTVPPTTPTAPIVSPEPSGVSPTATDGRAAVFPNTIIVYQRQVGPTGDSKQWTFYHTGRIVAGDGTEWLTSADQVKLLFSLAEAPAYWNLTDSYPAAGTCADCIVHILTVYQGGKIKKTTITQGAILPADLQQMLNEVDTLITR